MSLPTDYNARKALPVFDGVLMYFPDAILAVAAVSVAGNNQHNTGERLHWNRGKSMDQMNTLVRHAMDHGMGNQKDTDGTWHLAKVAWRALAALQLAIEAENAKLACQQENANGNRTDQEGCHAPGPGQETWRPYHAIRYSERGQEGAAWRQESQLRTNGEAALQTPGK